MKDIKQYGLSKNDEWETLPWLPDPRPPFHIWVKPEDITPFFLVQHYPFALSLLLRISDGFKADVFRKAGLNGGSKDWERLTKGIIKKWEESHSGIDLFHFDSDENIFCVFSQYIDDLMAFSKTLRAACDNEKAMYDYLGVDL